MNIDDDGIKKIIADSLLKTDLGARIKAVLDKAFESAIGVGPYSLHDRGPIQHAVNEYVRERAAEVLKQPDITATIDAGIRAKLTPEVIERVAANVKVEIARF